MIGAERQAHTVVFDCAHEIQHAAQYLRTAWSLVRNDSIIPRYRDALEQTEE